MSKKLATILILILFPFCGKAFAQMRDDVQMLCCEKFEGRAHGSLGIRYASQYIAERFALEGLRQAGNKGYFSDFLMPEGWNYGRNVIGIFPGLENYPVNSYIIIGAHYDALGTIHNTLYPGADYNASGVAMMLDIARRFKLKRQANQFWGTSIIFVAFDACCNGRAGAADLWKRISNGSLVDPVSGNAIRPDQILLMVDIDQIGSNLAPPRKNHPDYVIALGTQTLPEFEQNVLERCNQSSGANLDIWHSYYGSEKFTDAFYHLGDRKVFIKAGLSVLYFTSGITELNNTVNDIPQSLDYELMDRRSSLITAAVEHFLR